MMKYFRLIFKDKTTSVVKAQSNIELIKKFDLTSKKHINTKIIQLEGIEKNIAKGKDKLGEIQ